MAKAKRTTKRKKKQPDIFEELRRGLLRPEVIGLALILVSAFTLLSLVTNSRGSLTGAWIELLQRLVGVGVWGVPLALGAVGFWIIIYAIERMPNLPWQRPSGIALILVAYTTAASLMLPRNVRYVASQRSDGGGIVGYYLAETLEQNFGYGGAWAFVTFLIVSGVLFLTDRWLIDGVQAAWAHFLDWREARQRETHRPPAGQGTFHYGDPEEHLPLWKRFFSALGQSAPLAGETSAQPPPVINPQTPAPARSGLPPSHGQSGAPEQGATPSAPERKPATPPLDDQGDMLTPRVIGGSSPVRLPDLDKVLVTWDRVAENDNFLREQGRKIEETLSLFGVPVNFAGANQGPTVTQYLISPGYEERTVRGEKKRLKVKVNKIMNLTNDLALALEARSVRIEAPVPGTSYVGVEVDNQQSNIVGLKELMQSDAFARLQGKLRIALGEDVKGNAVVTDLARMPHLLIAGATGSGKSACINSIICTLLCTHTPATLKMLMVDPKMVELSVYNGIPHLANPVVTEVENAAKILYWAVQEMERRYQLFSKAGARDLERYNVHLEKRGQLPLPFIVVIVDEMADLMMAAPEEVEKHICRLAQMARAVGIHLIIATQRPSVDVITGLIKANFPARIAFAVTSQTDSRVILDAPGAERLLGKGDMLYMASDSSKLHRLQGTYVRDDEISAVVRHWKGIRSLENQPETVFLPDELAEEPPSASSPSPAPPSPAPPPRPTKTKNAASPKRPPPATPGKVDLGGDPMSHGRAWTVSDEDARAAGKDSAVQASLLDEVDAAQTDDERDGLFDEAVRVIQEAGGVSVTLLQRKLRVGPARANRLIDELEEMGILGPARGDGHSREVLIGKTQSTADRPPGSASGKSHGMIRSGGDDMQVWF